MPVWGGASLSAVWGSYLVSLVVLEGGTSAEADALPGTVDKAAMTASLSWATCLSTCGYWSC